MNMHTLGLIIHAKCPVKFGRCCAAPSCLCLVEDALLSGLQKPLAPFFGCKVLPCQMATVIGCQWPYLVRVRRA